MDAKTEWADFFDAYAPQYETNDFTRNTLAEVDFLTRELQLAAPQTILDVGCGTGRHSIELARRGFRVTGLDLSAGMLAEAAKRAATAGVSVEWVESNAASFSFERPFDAVICLCEGAFGLLGSADDPVGQPLAILRNVAAALRPERLCLFTVLNACALIRKHGPDQIAQGQFDPLALVERSECAPSDCQGPSPLRERGFVPTEIVLLFALAGLEVTAIWGGTAGNWGKRAIDPDEIEIMVVARRSTALLEAPYALYAQR